MSTAGSVIFCRYTQPNNTVVQLWQAGTCQRGCSEAEAVSCLFPALAWKNEVEPGFSGSDLLGRHRNADLQSFLFSLLQVFLH